MKTLLMMKIYAAVGLAVLGVRLAFEYLSVSDLILFFASAIGIGLASTLLHKFFEHQSHKTGKNAITNSGFLAQMIVVTILASTGIYMLISYISSGEFSVGFDIIFYILFIPAVVLFGVWLYFRVVEQEYNEKLQEIQKKR
jgi:hypothetical protein